MEEISKNLMIRRANKKKRTVNEKFNSKNKPIHLSHHKRSNSDKIKKIPSILGKKNVINLITKGPSITKLFFKKNNVSLKSGSMPKSKKRHLKKFRSINIERDKNEISQNINIKKFDSLKSSNQKLNYLNMDFIEKKNNLRGEAKDFLSNKETTQSKNNNSNDNLEIFNNNLKANKIYMLNSPFEEKEMIKKPLQKIESVNQEKKVSKFLGFKILKNEKKEEEDDESYENINPDDFREGNNIQLIGESSFSEINNESSSLSSNENKLSEKKDKKNDKNLNNSNNSENEDYFFKNETNFFRSPKQNSKRPSNKSLKSDSKNDYLNNIMAYFNESNNNDSPQKNTLFEDPVNKNNIRKNESFKTNSIYEYNGDVEEYDLAEIEKKVINNLNINDSYISQNKNNNATNNENNNIHVNKNDNDYNNNLYKNNNSNNNIINKSNPNLNINMSNYNYDNGHYLIKNIHNINSINNNNNKRININNNDFLGQNNSVEFPIRNFSVNTNQSNIISTEIKSNLLNNNIIIGNQQSILNSNNSINNILNSNYHQNNSFNNISLPNRINGQNFDINNYLINNNIIGSFQHSQLQVNNNLMNNMSNNSNRIIYKNSNNFQQNINNNHNCNNNLNYLNNNLNYNLNSNINRMSNNFNYLYNYNNFINSNIEGNNKNINNNINLLNYNNSGNIFNNDINNYINNLNMTNNHFKNNSQIENLHNYQNQIHLNQNMKNANNSNLLNNYINLNQNLNLNDNINLNNIKPFNNNGILNSSIIPNINSNIFQNSNINNFKNNKYIHNYKRIHSSGNLNHIILNNNNNINIISRANKKNNYLPNRQNKLMSNLLSDRELAKQAYILAKNQNECKYLQKKIENNPDLVPSLFFPNILGHIEELSNDQFGNYYINIIIKYLPENIIYKFIQIIHPSIPKIGTNQYGTKVLQTLIDCLVNEKNISFFIEKTLPHLVTLINDLNGIHIVQKLINIHSKHIQLIYNNIYQNIKLIAITRDGSNFLKRLLDIQDQNKLFLLINSINNYLDIIITNKYGNYVIQEIILKNNLTLKNLIFETIMRNIVNFSNQKFSSNVVEKCFEIDEMKEKVIDEILKNNNFEKILLNEYGNYVIQKALYKSDQNRQQKMLKLVVPLVIKLQCLPFGQKLLSKLFISYPRLSIYILNSE